MCTLWVCYSSACTSVSYLSKSRSGCNCSLEVTACKLSCHTFPTPNRSAALFPCLWIRIKLAGIQLVGLAAAAVICVSHLSGWQTKNPVDKNQWPSGLEIPWAMDFVSKISGASQTFLYRMASLPLYFSSNASKKFTSDSASPNLIKALGADATQNNMKRNMWQWLSHLFLTWTSHIAGWNKFA